jgi:hypothetical protein
MRIHIRLARIHAAETLAPAKHVVEASDGRNNRVDDAYICSNISSNSTANNE